MIALSRRTIRMAAAAMFLVTLLAVVFDPSDWFDSLTICALCVIVWYQA